MSIRPPRLLDAVSGPTCHKTAWACERNIDKLFPTTPKRFHRRLSSFTTYSRAVSAKAGSSSKRTLAALVKLFPNQPAQTRHCLFAAQQISDQHVLNRTPVADVVLTDNGDAHKFQHARNAVADDAGTQVADVHFFGRLGEE